MEGLLTSWCIYTPRGQRPRRIDLNEFRSLDTRGGRHMKVPKVLDSKGGGSGRDGSVPNGRCPPIDDDDDDDDGGGGDDDDDTS